GLVSSEKMDYGAVIVAPEAPTMVGHSFSKWIGFKEGMTVPAEDIEFDAEYTVNSYTVTFRADGNIVSSVEMEFETEIVTPEAPEKVGYTFSKWIGFTEGMTVPSYNIVFDAEYTVNSYTVTFKAGDEIVSSGDYEYGTVIIAPEAPAVAGFEFVAWIGFTEGMTVPAEDVSFDAEYKDVRVTVTFMSEGKEFSSYKAVIGDAVILPEDVPTKENDADYSYVFDSWKGYTAEMVVKADVTFDAVFTAKTLVVIEEGKAIIGSGELVSVMIDDDALKAIKDGKASMVVKLKNGTVDVPASDVEKLVAGEIAIEKKGTSDNTTYTVAYGKNTEFGEPVTVTVPYELGERSIENVTVYDGDKKVDFQYEDGKMVFSTDHTATFAVEYCEPQKDNGLHLDILAEICILLAAVGSLLYVVMIRNKF
ncbi:MAG: InlB B-repeat-containing protein, partial [archaeon]|nr:InlB B-repeat-containing protein [archaeon]